MRGEDYDDIDESGIDVHAGHPVRVLLSLALDPGDYDVLSDAADREGRTALALAQDAVHEFAAVRMRSAKR